METAVPARLPGKLLITVILLTSFFNAFMGAGINVALPIIGREYSMNAVSLSWVAMSFLLSSAMFMLPAGKIADIHGRKKIFLYGNILYVISSLLCVIAPTAFTFISFRFFQGMGSALILATNLAIVASAYPPSQRGRVIGMNISAVYLGLTLAPALGGILTQALGWRSIFYVNILAGTFIVLAIIIRVKDEWAEDGSKQYDYRGALLYMPSIFLLMYAFSQMPSTLAYVLAFAGLAGLMLFARAELLSATPLLDVKLFRHNRIFTMSNLAALINYAATFAITFILSLFLQYAKGLSPRDAGMILITQPGFMALVASFAGRLSDRYESRILVSVGMTAIVAGLIMLVFVNAATGIPYLVLSLAIVGLGFGFFTSPNTNAIMGAVERQHLAIASAIASTMRAVGMMLSMGIAAMVIHALMGETRISNANVPLFIKSAQIIFIIFAALCTLGIFASLARGKKNIQA
jgi:EmrB/QacA subfamily drug resistance transporter